MHLWVHGALQTPRLTPPLSGSVYFALRSYQVLDKGVKTNTLHKNTAARRKSRLARAKKAVEISKGWYVPA